MSFDPSVTQTTPATSTVETTPAPATQGTPAAPSATQVAPAPSPANTGSQPPATGGAPSEGYVPSYRLRETREAVLREAARYVQQREAELNAQIREREEKIKALAGFGPQPDQEVETIKDQIKQLFPQLARLDDSKVDALLQLLDNAPNYQAQTDHYWTQYGQQAIGKLFSLAEADLGQQLSEEAKNHLYHQFTGYIASSPEITNRYASDPNFVADYWKAFTSNFIEPVRRVSSVSAQTRAMAPTPQDNAGGAPRTAPTPKPSNLDEAVQSAWAAYSAVAKR